MNDLTPRSFASPSAQKGDSCRPSRAVRLCHGANAWVQVYCRNPSRGWHKFTYVGRPLPGRAWSPYGNTSPWRATHYCLCPQRVFLRWGDRGEFDATLQAGDFLYVPAWLPHQEINPSKDVPFQWIVVRSTSEAIVVNLRDDLWDELKLISTGLRAEG